MVASNHWQYWGTSVITETSTPYYNVGLFWPGIEATPLFLFTCFSIDRKTLQGKQPKYMQKKHQPVLVGESPELSQNFLVDFTEKDSER